ncbi:hypothetical protein CARUB_v10003355mg [Capsella rubella]|uniref:Membrane lipoprotein n=1 Tax=Capsella rubella TaxID=81985 RepID=R0FC13_9BRAS|nr:uncharacterized protein LOC17881805 [Capsella rubella]EOA19326.1 hypothetical protein CARUB_v10003355mg [Capsella rubella]
MAGTTSVCKMMMMMALVMMACGLQACNGMKNVGETISAMEPKLECFKTCSISCGIQNKPCYQNCLTKCGLPQQPTKPSSPSTTA